VGNSNAEVGCCLTFLFDDAVDEGDADGAEEGEFPKRALGDCDR
jgi:hypothetical protein